MNPPPEPPFSPVDSGSEPDPIPGSRPESPSGSAEREDLLLRYRAGDEAAFEELVEWMGPRLLGYFLRQGASPSVADDLVQRVFVRVLQNLDRYRPQGRLDAWLLRIARNLWIDRTRRKRPLLRFDEDLDAEDPRPGPDAMAVAADRAAALRDALRRLDPASRELLELAVLQRLPYGEVARLLGVPVGTVKSRVHYALRRLRSLLPPESP